MSILSVVVPVYNAEEFLPYLFSQLSLFPEEQVKIILVNDGSTDNSKALCQAQAESAANFTLIDQKNSGVSRARNAGLAEVTTDYLWFCDPDDKFDAHAIFSLLETTLADTTQPVPDVVSFSYDIFFMDSKQIYTYQFDNMRCSGLEVIKNYNNYKRKNNLSTVWNKLFRTELIHGNEIVFDITMHHSEDRVFNIHAFQHAQHVVMSPLMGYRYIKYSSGTLSTKFDQGRAINTNKADTIMVDYLASQRVDVSQIRDWMTLNYITLSCENAVRGDISLTKGYKCFRQEFYKAKDHRRISAEGGSTVNKLFCFLINHNSPLFFYVLFSLKIKARNFLNFFK
ncbi:glycosyltransferase [Erwinia typographi]|uniref:glycosyltransferase n=1 Tax=Erwinia typographi TaxID=371042 RepID=UPI00068DFAEA|nr:glycosyltransferase [Erwinia typographi]